MSRIAAAASVLAVVVSAHAQSVAAARGSLLLPRDEHTPVTKAQRELSSVDFAPGASAVVLLKGEQVEWDRSSDSTTQRVVEHRRVKILDEAGVALHGTYTWALLGESRIHEIAARTVLPDGTIVPCDDCVTQAGDERRGRSVRVAWPRVEPGAILDLRMHYVLDSIMPIPFRVQEELPVLEGRLVVLPPRGWRFGSAVLGLSDEAAQPERVRRGNLTGVAWTARAVPPIPDVPFRPPLADFASTIYLTLDSYPITGTSREYAPDWPTYARTRRDQWNEWLRGDDNDAAALAKSVASGASTPREKAEAIRQAVVERVTIDRHWQWARHDDPDEVLAAGRGRSADAVGLALAMLDAVGLDARAVGFRPPGEGELPATTAVTPMIEDVIVEVLPKDAESFWLVPWGSAGVGKVPASVRGGRALPYDKKVEGLVDLPPWTPEDNFVEQSATVDLAADGTLEGTVEIRRAGRKAVTWRERLAELDGDERASWLAGRLSATWPGASVKDVEVENIESSDEPLIVRAAVRSTDAVHVTGRRLEVKPVLLERMQASDLAAETREVPVDLGQPFRSTTRVALRLPRETAEITVPPSRIADGGPAGRYELAIDTKGHVFTAERTLELRQTRYPASLWDGLKAWLGDMAAADDGTLAITLRPAS